MASFFRRFTRTPSEQQFDPLVRPHIKALYQFAHRLTGNRHDAEDIVQDVLVKLLPKTQQMAALKKLRPWLMRVLYHQFIDTIRSQTKQTKTPLYQEDIENIDAHHATLDPSTTPLQSMQAMQLSDEISHALAQLNVDQRAIVSLHLIEGYTLVEVSEILDTPLGTLKSRLNRARHKLKKLLSMEPFDEN